jgi:hypothetical protein
MNIKEALIELQAGKAIKRIGAKEVYYCLASPCFEGHLIDEVDVTDFDSGKLCSTYLGTTYFSEEDVFAEDWIVYTRPRDLAPDEAV